MITVTGPIAPEAIGPMCQRVRALAAQTGACDVSYDVAGVERCDLGAVDLMARLILAARRVGASVTIRGANPELAGLIELCGLAGVIPATGSGVEARRQAEEREEPLRVEEERDAGDLAV